MKVTNPDDLLLLHIRLRSKTGPFADGLTHSKDCLFSRCHGSTRIFEVFEPIFPNSTVHSVVLFLAKTPGRSAAHKQKKWFQITGVSLTHCLQVTLSHKPVVRRRPPSKWPSAM